MTQCIVDYLGKGNLPQTISCESTPIQILSSHSEYYQEVRDRAFKNNRNVPKEDLLILIAVIWSDDFDPNSKCMNNWGAFWIKILTFISPTNSSNGMNNTYSISIRSKRDNYDVIGSKMINELLELRNGKENVFYSKVLNKNVHIHFEVIVSLGDQPKRRVISYIMSGKYLFSARFGYLAHINKLKQYIPSCQSLF